MSNRRLAINMVATIFSFLVTMGINFILSPYIINTVGKEAYGFVGLANNFIGYAQIITIAINSMAGRFITIKIHKGEMEAANKYLTSVVLANILTALFLLIPFSAMILNLKYIINVPQYIQNDIQILWALVFINFLIGLVLGTFSISTFVTNRLDLSSIRDMQSNIIRVIILILSFSFFTPSVWYIGLASIVCTIFVGVFNIYYKIKLLPDIKVRLKYFDIKVIIELLYSGIWHVVIKLGQILSDGLDLLISNIFIDSSAMGLLAIAKTVPTTITSLLGIVTGVFTPQLTIYYAKNDKDKLVNELIKSMKLTGLFTNIPLAFLLVFGTTFYTLWVPNEDVNLIQITSILTVYGVLATGVINPLFGVFTLTNNVKLHSFVIVLNGLINTILVLILMKTTKLGILAIAGVSSTTCTIRNLIYTPIYASYCLQISKKTFYPVILKYMLSSTILVAIFSLLTVGFINSNWITLILYAIISGVIGIILNYIILLDNPDKIYFKSLLHQIYRKIKKCVFTRKVA